MSNLNSAMPCRRDATATPPRRRRDAVATPDARHSDPWRRPSDALGSVAVAEHPIARGVCRRIIVQGASLYPHLGPLLRQEIRLRAEDFRCGGPDRRVVRVAPRAVVDPAGHECEDVEREGQGHDAAACAGTRPLGRSGAKTTGFQDPRPRSVCTYGSRKNTKAKADGPARPRRLVAGDIRGGRRTKKMRLEG